MAKFLHCQRRPGILLKLDITKAFDTVSWPFLLEVLTHLGIGHRWRTLLCNLLHSSSTRVILNGELGDQIRHRCGLRQGDPLSPMLFIIAMDVLTSLVEKVDYMGLLEPLATRWTGHHVSICADDVVLFASPKQQDLRVIKDIITCFGSASGLKTNMLKSSIIPIPCEESQQMQARDEMGCELADFPCRYLGLPLSLHRLTKEDLQPILDKIADSLPGWKASMLATSGRLALFRAVLTAILIYLLLPLDVPKWFIKAVDKYRCQFLWRGRKELRGGHCPVNWERVTRPLQFGGLGIHNLQILSWALRMRWAWLKRTDTCRPWAMFDVQIPANAISMFEISMIAWIGDGVHIILDRQMVA